MAILETHDIGKRYGRRTWALRHVDLEVPDGSITALVGPNGSGKSTLLKAWVGFEPPTEGYLTVDGIDPWKDRGRGDRSDRLRAPGPVALPRTDGRRARADGEDASPVFRPGNRPPSARRPRHPAGLARRRAVRRAAGTGRPGPCARRARAGPPARRAAGQPRPAGATRVPARPGRRRPRRRLDGTALVARHHRHRAGLRPAARPRRRQDAARPVDRWGHRRAPGHRRDRWTGLRATRRRHRDVPRPRRRTAEPRPRDRVAGGRPATLEEVVLGHLAAARRPRATAAAGRAA